MSKSLKRVKAALEAGGVVTDILEMSGATRTAVDAAREIGCQVDQIAKSIIFRGDNSGVPILFVTAGGRQVIAERAEALAGEPLGRADAAFVRAQTGFAIGGVSPVGHIGQTRAFFDQYLLSFDRIYAAAGTPHHIFGAEPTELMHLMQVQASDFSV